MAQNKFIFEATLWVSDGPGGWHFITVPQEISVTIRQLYSGLSRPFSSIPVVSQVGQIQWKTSIFYDTKAAAYFLPVKKEVRSKAKLLEGQQVKVELEVRG